jgi:hypothetical protein
MPPTAEKALLGAELDVLWRKSATARRQIPAAIRPEGSSQMSNLVKMFGPPGTDEANHGTMRFIRHSDGTFYVDPLAVEPLCKVGGFVVAPAADPAVAASASAAAAGKSPAEIADLISELERIAVEVKTSPAPHRIVIPT